MVQRKRKTVEEQIVDSANSEAVIKDDRVEFISTGSVMLNLALSQKARDGGWGRGRIANIVGDGSTGKTLLALEAMANAFYKPESLQSNIFPDITKMNLIYWNRESVMDFPLESMYGEPLVSAIEWCDRCITAEEWGRDVFRRLASHKEGDFFLGVLDSIDSLGTESGISRLEKSVKSDAPMDGSYGSGPERAKYFSSDFFNNLCSKMKGKDFTLILISQIRTKMDAMAFGEKSTRTGGKALDFYTHQAAWLAQLSKLTDEYDKIKRVNGTKNRAKIKRNKTAPPYREADFDILFDHGLDDIGSMVNFLSAEKIRDLWAKQEWKEKFNGLVATRSNLIEIADNNPEVYESLVDYVEDYWNEVEDNIRVKRNPRFKNVN